MNVDELYTVERHSKGAKMQVNDENGKPLDMFLILAGVDSKAFRKAKAEMSREILKDLKGDHEALRAESLAKVTIGWEGFNSKGKPLDFSKKLAKQLYINAPYVMDQADGFIFNRVNFTKS